MPPFDSRSLMNNDRLLAVVGLGLTVPGAANVEQFWQAVLAGERFFGPPRPEDFGAEPERFLEAGPPAPDKVYSLSGAFNRAAPSPALRNIVAGWDKSSRYLMEAAWESLRLTKAGEISPLLAGHDPNRIGLIAGQVILPTSETAQGILATVGRAWSAELGLEPSGEEAPALDELDEAGLSASVFETVGASARKVAGALGFGGPAFTVDAACASSLYALKLAALELYEGRVTAALVGGVAAPDRLFTQMGFCQLRALSPSGLASPFDQLADGLVVGEGAGLLLLKSLDRALADGDRPLAVIRGVGLSNDQGGGLLAPEKEGQLRAMRRAWRAGGLDGLPPGEAGVGLVEAHGTGTPVGDEVELSALREFWKADAQPSPGPVIGSVKGNIGHLLSAAGALGLIKAVLALNRKLLPPSGGFNNLSQALELGCFRILKTALAWPPPPSGLRRALVNAFGFGGANAQVILEEFREGRERARRAAARKAGPRPKKDRARLVVAGISMIGGPAEGNPEKIILDARAYRTSPKELRAMLPQQALFLRAGHDLWHQLNLAESTFNPERLGLVAGVDLDPRASEYILRWRWAEPVFKRLAAENSLPLEDLAAFKDSLIPALDADGTVGALGSIVASRLAKFLKIGGPAFTLSSGRDSGLTALRAAAGLLTEDVLDLVMVGAVEAPGSLRLNLGPSEKPRFFGAGILALTTAEMAETWNLPVWAEYDPDGYDSPNRAVCPPEWNFEAGAATGFFRLAAGLNLLARGLKPSSSGSARPWLADAHDGPRHLDINPSVAPGPVISLAAPPVPLVYFERKKLGPVWFFLPARDLPAELERLATMAGEPGDLPDLAGRHWLTQAYPAKSWRLALGAGNLADLKSLAAEVGRAWAGGKRLKHPEVLWAPEKPLYGGLALVFPGSGNQYPRMSRPWAEAAPGAIGELMAESDYAASQFQPAFFLESSEWPQPPSVLEVILGQVSLGGLIYKILKRVNFKPEAALGYSLGESAALVATGAWANRDALFLRLVNSSLFTDDLAGDCRAARAYWGLSASEPLEWSVAVVGVGFAQFQAAWSALPPEQREKVFLLLINTQEECVIGGESGAVKAMGRLLGRRLLPLNGVAAVHNPTVQPVAESYRALHLMEIGPPTNIKYYSSARGRAYALTAETAADSITEQALSGHNFVRLINQAYQDGIRYFLELGPGGSATRLIKSILKGRPCWAHSLDQPGALDLKQAVRVMAGLTLQEKPINWARLYEGPARARLLEPGLPVELHFERAKPDWRRRWPDLGRAGFRPAGLERAPRPEGQWPQKMRLEAQTGNSRNGEPAAENAANRAGALKPEISGAPAGPDQPGAGTEAGEAASESVTPKARCGRPTKTVSDERASAPKVVKAKALKTKAAGRGRPRKLSLDDQWAAVGVVPLKPAAESAEPGLRERAEKRKPARAEPPSRLEQPGPASSAVKPEAPDSRKAGAGLEPLIRLLDERPAGRAWAQAVQAADDSYWQWLAVFGELAEKPEASAAEADPPRVFDRAAGLTFAVGAVADVLGPRYAPVDRHPTRVRLPDEPLMLVDRILKIEGEPLKLGPGRIVTEHNVLPPGGWYLENGHMPASLAVEAGQADLFLASFLGLDFITRGLARYRLLDAEVTMRRDLPRAGETVNYDIRILRFFKHNHTHLFRFEFDATIEGRLILTMRNGCAGFFTPKELASGKGLPALFLAGRPGGAPPLDYQKLALAPVGNLNPLTGPQMDALRQGELREAFGPDFSGLFLEDPLTLPGGRLALIDRIVSLTLTGGRYGRGLIRAESDIDPKAWFLTCHFVDDQVMPGTLMFEGCLHTLRIFLLRLGWVGERLSADWQPVLGVQAGLKCRGQVTAATKTVAYEVHLKELGFNPEPYALADAVMYADGRPIVNLTGLSLRLMGLDREALARQWSRPNDQSSFQIPGPAEPAAFEKEQLAAFTEGGPPSALFGDRYKPLDENRFVARLPRGDYALLDRVLKTSGPTGTLAAGQWLWAEFQSRADDWYLLEAGGLEPRMPYAVLNEIALQPCGFLAAYMGSALEAENPWHFRNLGGQARLLTADGLAAERLITRAEAVKISRAGDMIIEHFNFRVFTGGGRLVYEGRTYFGFFTPQALAAQTGLSGEDDGSPSLLAAFSSGSVQAADLTGPAWPQGRLAILNRVESVTDPRGRLLVKGEAAIDPKAWFFHDHFYQDPVWPGSLGLESFWLLGKAAAWRLFKGQAGFDQESAAWRAPSPGSRQEWIYRGQVIPANKKALVVIEVVDSDQSSRSLSFNGYLLVDGRPIYKVRNFSLALA